MGAYPIRTYSGAEAMQAGEKLRKHKETISAWPYVHIFPPPDSTPVHQIGTAAVPALAATVVVLTYTVPSGFRFVMKSVLITVPGPNFVVGDSTWTIDRNAPVGIPDAQGQPVQGFINLPLPLGSNLDGPWPLERAYEFEPLDVLRLKGTNVNLIAGAPNYYVGGFFGYLVPVLLSGKR